MPEGHLQDDRDVEQILKIAVRGAGFSDEEALRQRLNAAGHELGLSPQQIAAAEEKYRKQKDDDLAKLEFDTARKKELWEHLWSYLIVNAGLIGFDFFQDGRLSWALWPLIGWGIGVAFHVLSTYLTGTEDYNREFQRWRKRKDRNLRRRQRREQKAEEATDGG